MKALSYVAISHGSVGPIDFRVSIIMSETTMITIEGKHREVTGKGACRRIRRDGMIPANLCHKGKATKLEINPKFLSRAWKNEKKFNLSLDGKILPVLITELQLDHVKRLPLHVDLAHV